MNRRTALTLVSLMLLLALTTVSHAATTMYDNRAAWEAAASALTWSVADVALPPEWWVISAVSLPAPAPPATTLSFDVTQEVRQVPGSWGTWSGVNTPLVLYGGTDSVIGTFNAAIRGFGLEMEPNNQTLYDMTLDLGGGISLTQNVNGYGGAAFFGFLSDTGVVGWTASADPNALSFAMGRLVVAGPVGTPPGNGSPELSTWMLLACSGLAGLVIRRRRRS